MKEEDSQMFCRSTQVTQWSFTFKCNNVIRLPTTGKANIFWLNMEEYLHTCLRPIFALCSPHPLEAFTLFKSYESTTGLPLVVSQRYLCAHKGWRAYILFYPTGHHGLFGSKRFRVKTQLNALQMFCPRNMRNI